MHDGIENLESLNCTQWVNEEIGVLSKGWSVSKSES